MIPIDEVFEELRKVPWFQELDPGDVRKFAEISNLRHFKAGEAFFHEGDKQDYFYIVLSGRVALDMFVPHRGKVRFFTCEEWDSFGWSSVTPQVRTRTAGAVGVMAGTVIATDTTSLFPTGNEDEAHYLCAIINSKPVREFLKSFSSAGRGFGAPSVMEPVGIPPFDVSNTLHGELASHSKQLHKKKSRGLDIECTALEREVDDAVRRLFGLK